MPAKARYMAFEEALSDTDDNRTYGKYLSNRLMSFHKKAASKEEQDSYRKPGAFPLWLTEETAFHERSRAEGQCVTVSGKTYDGKPGYVAIRYIKEHGSLKADDIHYEYLETRQDFPSEAICPDEITLSFPSDEDGQ
ncbi:MULTISPECIES: hypothetical protein [Halomonadaceae]|uniref:Uncharacterized protein n=1 Tax=Vreelandella halophila TaxID=86177 RepID=A0A9X4YCC7_9GAMM|nr:MULTISPECIES: hypothetical protein [Halomonas]MYL26513.1 hypothetical protein [Halomonas utahensis]MYL73850.1 hypothetical protein [Halomonas sp. 22501_18_FS]